ncbi:MAG: DegV family protein [Bacilli bacterium]|jgi:DegV family protein with EDD domain
MKLAIITDSSANLETSYIAGIPFLWVLPLMIIIGGIPYRDQIDVQPGEVYAQLDKSKVTTSLPDLQELKNTLDAIKTEGYTDVLSINISSGLSGTYNAFSLFFDNYEGLKIHKFDSKTLAGAQGMLVMRAVALAEQGQHPEAIIQELTKLRYEDSLAFYTINTLKYLKRGGRIGKIEGTIGDILHIKPVITVSDEGVYTTFSKNFGFNRAIMSIRKALTNKFNETPIDVIIHYGDDEAMAQSLAVKLRAELKVNTLTITQLTPVLGIHTGPEMIAVIAWVAA